MMYLEFVNDSRDTVLININRVALNGLVINSSYLAESEPIRPSTHRAVTVNLTPGTKRNTAVFSASPKSAPFRLILSSKILIMMS